MQRFLLGGQDGVDLVPGSDKKNMFLLRHVTNNKIRNDIHAQNNWGPRNRHRVQQLQDPTVSILEESQLRPEMTEAPVQVPDRHFDEGDCD